MKLNVEEIVKSYPRLEDRILKRQIDDINLIIIHHTVMDDNPITADVYKLFEYFSSSNNHITPGKPLAVPAYHEIIEKVNNQIIFFQTAYLEDIVYAVGSWNSISYNISINQTSWKQITPNTYDMLIERLSQLCIQFNLNSFAIRGHRELYKTGWRKYKGQIKPRKNCPGFISLPLLRYNCKLNLQKMNVWNYSRTLPEEVINSQYINKKWLIKNSQYLKLL